MTAGGPRVGRLKLKALLGLLRLDRSQRSRWQAQSRMLRTSRVRERPAGQRAERSDRAGSGMGWPKG